MIRFNVTDEIREKARLKAEEMGRLNNSIRSGAGNMVGFIGEEVVAEILGATEANTYDYDLIKDGLTIDVKSKQTSVPPKPDFECSVADFNTKQNCDLYAFVRVRGDLRKAWFLGVYLKEDYYKDAKFMKKGDIDPSNDFTVKADCYNMPIHQLFHPSVLDSDENASA